MEFVFVVPRAKLFPEWTPHGLSIFEANVGEERVTEHEGPLFDRALFDRVVREEGFFVERGYAEQTPALKQLIPYTIVRRGDDILVLRRTNKGGEVRLHDKLSIGVGGHVNPVDAAGSTGSQDMVIRWADSKFARLADPLPAATTREVIEEELEVSGTTHLTPVGLLNDDTNPVGAVHVGLVQVLELENGDARVREVDQLEGTFASVADVRRQLQEGANFETWSALLVPQLDRIMGRGPNSEANSRANSGNPSARETPASSTQRPEAPLAAH